MAKRAVQQDLPGTEDRKIRALENAGREYAEIRDERIALNVREAKLKKNVRSLMAKHEKTDYVSDEVEIHIEPPDGEDRVKVRLKKPKALDAGDDPSDAGDGEE